MEFDFFIFIILIINKNIPLIQLTLHYKNFEIKGINYVCISIFVYVFFKLHFVKLLEKQNLHIEFIIFFLDENSFL